jgi:hypothetical protein
MESPFRYLVQNSTKSLCQLQDSDNFGFLDKRGFRLFCASFSNDLVTILDLKPF